MVRLPPDHALQSAMLATGGWSEARVVQLPAQEVSARSVGLTLQLVTKQPSAEDNATVMNKSIQWVAVPTALSGAPFISTPRPEQSVSRALLTLSEIVKAYISSSRHHQQAPIDARLGSPVPRLVVGAARAAQRTSGPPRDG